MLCGSILADGWVLSLLKMLSAMLLLNLIEATTVKIHQGRVMQKLEIVSVAELVRLCEKVGIPPAEPQNR